MIDYVKGDTLLRRFVIKASGRKFVFVSSTIDHLMDLDVDVVAEREHMDDQGKQSVIDRKGHQ